MPRLGFEDDLFSMVHVENVSYLRLNTLNLGYDLPQHFCKKVGMQNIRLFFTGENLFLWTNYSGMDPELVDDDGIDDLRSYPLPRKFTLGFTLNF